jgi:uncharacterized membrane protein
MRRYLLAYPATAIAFVGLDFLWLGTVARDFYYGRLGDLLLTEPDIAAAIVFYLIYVAGIMVFATAPALASGGWRTALARGALFGFFAYATYDLTNLATLRGFPVAVAVVDMAWGTVLTGVAAALGFLVAGRSAVSAG